ALVYAFVFFFSSRRRHTRLVSDWSSDVCSSDLTREFGVRLALGATPSDLTRMVLRHGTSLVGTGTVLGLAGALGAARLLGGILYGVTATDWPTYVAAAAGLLGIGLAASYIPARRATRLDPAVVLRTD